MKKIALITLFLVSSGALAAEEMRLAGRMLFKLPELAKPGACVMYREGGAGWILTEPVYWLKGTTVAAEVRKRAIGVCPTTASEKTIDQYTRAEFNLLANAQPCVSKAELSREEDVGIIRLRLTEWETPWAKRAANTWRLYQGHYLDKALKKGQEIEIDADLLSACQ